MRYLLYILCFSACIFPKNNQSKAVNYTEKIIDTSRYAVLHFGLDTIDKYIFKAPVKAALLSDQEIYKIERAIDTSVTYYNRTAPKALSIHNSKKYNKQFIAVINANGEKEVWVNCFCLNEKKDYWRKKIVMVFDGGSCFFQLKINLTKNKVYDFSVNGVG